MPGTYKGKDGKTYPKRDRVYARQLNLVKLGRVKKGEMVVAEAENWSNKQRFTIFDPKTISALVDYLMNGGESSSFDIVPSKKDPQVNLLYLSKFQPKGKSSSSDGDIESYEDEE
jgi:hypothetical protein